MNLARFGSKTVLGIAVFAMLMQQAFSYVCQIVMPILADRLAEDFDISRAWLGLFLLLQHGAAIMSAMGCGGFILRYGPVRVSQFCLILMGAGLFVISFGVLWLYPLCAILLGVSSVSTPASSHILAKVCPPRLAPIIFSIKQTGVPVGSLIGGLLIPFLLSLSFYSFVIKRSIHLDAYGTALVTGLLVYLVAVALQPIRSHFDSERDYRTKLSFSGVSETMRIVTSNSQLRDLSFGAFAFGGLQAIFAGFFILFLIDGLNYSETQAGSIFAISAFMAVIARIFWGYLASTVSTARTILGGIGIFGAFAAVLVSLFNVNWSYSLILTVAALYNITALSWHGILLAEVARLAPPAQIGGVTGGVLSFTSIAMMTYPALYGGILAITDSYSIGFLVCSIPSIASGIIFLRKPIENSLTVLLIGYFSRFFVIKNFKYATKILLISFLFAILFTYLRIR